MPRPRYLHPLKIKRARVKIPREILTLGGQAARKYLDPRGSSCPGVKINRYTGIRLLLLIHPFISTVFFLSNFQTLKIFVALFSGTVRPIKLKLDIHVEIGWMYCEYHNQAATFYLSLISLFFFLPNVQKLKIFVTLFSGTVRPRNFKLGTLFDNGWMYHVYQNQAAAAYLSLYFFIFLSLQLSNITFFFTLFSGTVRPRKLKLGTHVEFVDSRYMYCVYRN